MTYQIMLYISQKGNKGEDYKSIISIYYERKLASTNKFGIAKNIALLSTDQTAVCFSEIFP